MSIYSSRLISKTLCLVLLCALSNGEAAFAIDEKDELSAYQKYIAEERRQSSQEESKELIASGVAAIVIGVYGYYNTSPNPLVKLLYAATQTAGVITVGQAIRAHNTPHLSLTIDDALNANGDEMIRKDALRAEIGKFKKTSVTADSRTLGYTSSVLSALYFYNGYREKGGDSTLRNVYYFLGFNFAIAGGIGFYQLYRGDSESKENDLSSFELFPYPTWTYRF